MNKNIALIESDIAGYTFQLAGVNSTEGYVLKKVLMKSEGLEAKESMQQKYPAAEIVQHSQAIMQDDDIDLIIVSAREKNNLRLLGEILQTGKHVRII